MSFGSKLRELRISQHLTQEDLAKKINLSKANVSKYEADAVEPNIETLKSLSEIFNVSLDYLLDNKDNAQQKSSTKVIGQKLKELRTKKGVTQDEMAELLNIKRQTYSAYERDISLPDVNSILSIAEFFGVSTDYLLSDKPNTDKNQYLSTEQKELLTSFDNLSNEAQAKAAEYIEMLKTLDELQNPNAIDFRKKA